MYRMHDIKSGICTPDYHYWPHITLGAPPSRGRGALLGQPLTLPAKIVPANSKKVFKKVPASLKKVPASLKKVPASPKKVPASPKKVPEVPADVQKRRDAKAKMDASFLYGMVPEADPKVSNSFS